MVNPTTAAVIRQTSTQRRKQPQETRDRSQTQVRGTVSACTTTHGSAVVGSKGSP
jgi:hypothetical protein